MQLSLSKLPWYGQIGAFVLVAGRLRSSASGSSTSTEMQADIAIRAEPARRAAQRHRSRRGDGAPAARVPVAGRPSSSSASRACAPCCRKRRTSPTSCAACRGWRRSRTCRSSASRRSRRSSRRSTPSCRSSSRPRGRITTSACSSIASASSSGSSTSATSRSRRSRSPSPGATIVAECVATTFVLQEGSRPAPAKPGAPAGASAK